MRNTFHIFHLAKCNFICAECNSICLKYKFTIA